MTTLALLVFALSLTTHRHGVRSTNELIYELPWTIFILLSLEHLLGNSLSLLLFDLLILLPVLFIFLLRRLWGKVLDLSFVLTRYLLRLFVCGLFIAFQWNLWFLFHFKWFFP